MDAPVRLMDEALAVCERGIQAGQSPFGAVIVLPDGKLVCAAHNTVRLSCDPTAHAEINVIREAARLRNTIDLSGMAMFTTCEPCPMCAAAIHWARLDTVYFGASIRDAEAAGFNELSVPCRSMYGDGNSSVKVVGGVLGEECRRLFELWKNGPSPVPY